MSNKCLQHRVRRIYQIENELTDEEELKKIKGPEKFLKVSSNKREKKEKRLTLINIYGPTESKTKKDKDTREEFYHELDKLIKIKLFFICWE